VGNLDGADGTNPVDVAHARQAVVSGARRLTRVEYDNTLHDLLGDSTRSGFAELPEDVNDPFDNNYTTQLPSPSRIEAVEKLAQEAALRALAEPAIHDKIIPCKPTGPGDAACLRQFITTFGRRALRRSLAEDEVQGYLGLQAYAVEGNSFDIGVELVLRAMLQDVEFLYRVEVGTPVEGVPGTFKLDDHEVAMRLSYFLWGSTPSDALLDLADAGKLSTPADVRSAAVTMMTDPSARERVNRFHALWLSYHQHPHPPALEIMLDSHGSLAGPSVPAPLRYLVCFGGQSLGGDGDPLHNDYVPNKIGKGYDLKSALAPLGVAGVADEISVISGLTIPTAHDNGGVIPAGGRSDDFHINSLSPLFSGVRSGAQTVNGVTSDQIVAAQIGATTFPSLVYRVQAGWYLSVAAPYGRDLLSYKDGGPGNAPIPIPATVSPKAAFDSLFYNFSVPTDPGLAKQKDFEWRERKSVVDLVKTRAERLVSRLGGADKQRIQRHLDEIRDLEKRISALPPVAKGACVQLGDPGMDPTFGGDQGTDGSGNNTYDTNLGYSGEDLRAPVFCDLMHMAFACDLTRVGSLMFTMAQSHMNMFALTQQPCDLHELGHGGVPGPSKTLEVSKAIAWHMKHFACLIKKLRDTPDGAGTLLDSCAVVFLHEGGHGYDPSSGEMYSTHSTENMACLVARRAGGMKPGQHIAATGMHPANALITAMNAVGVKTNTLGEVSGNIPALLVG